MALGVSLDIDIASAVSGYASMRARARDQRPALRSIARAGVASTRRRFLTGRGPDGTPWKKGHKTTGQTLILSGLLLRSISDRPPSADAVEWGSNRSYAAIHQAGFDGTVGVSQHSRVVRSIFGRPVQPTTQHVTAHQRDMQMPARPYLGISDADRRQFLAIYVRHVAGEAAA